MKKKWIAILLAVVFGSFGAHKFYLRNPGQGVFYVILTMMTLRVFSFSIATVLSWFDALNLLMMDERAFDRKYNWQQMNRRYQKPDDKRRGRRVTRKAEEPKPTRRSKSRSNAFKKSGIKKLQDFEVNEAIEDLIQAQKISPEDPEIHFNLACAYSLTEKTQMSLSHLSDAVAFGFKKKDLIHSHDALAFLRIQPEFESFVKNEYKYHPSRISKPKEDDLLEKLNKLKELKEKGLLSQEEFATEVKKLQA